jgi:hypothetical protein
MSSTYKSLIALASQFADAKTVQGVIERQLQPGMTADSFSPSDLKTVMTRVSTALKLYVPDPGKRELLAAGLQKLV